MAVARMRKVTILAFKERERDLFEKLRDLGLMEITQAGPIVSQSESQEVDDRSEGLVSGKLVLDSGVSPSQAPVSEEESLEYSDRISKLLFIKSYFERYNMIKKGFIDMFTGKKPEIASSVVEDAVKNYDIDAVFQKLTSHDQRLKDISKELRDIDAELESLLPWKNLDITIGEIGHTESCENFLAVVPSSALADYLAQSSEGAFFCEVVWEEKGRSGIWVLAHKDEFSSLVSAISSMGGAVVDLKRVQNAGKENSLVSQIIDGLNERRRALVEEMQNIQSEDSADSRDLVKVLALIDYFLDKKNLQRTREKASDTRFTFVINGFVRAKDVGKLRDAFLNWDDVEIIDEEPSPDDEVPIYLENHPLIRPFEVITNIFGYPKYNEIDPTPILAPFFWLFFGICLADAVYGVVLTLGCWYFLKTQKLAEGGKKLVTLLMYSGISSAIMGVLMGSWMGDLFSVFFKGSALERFILKLTILNPIEDPLTLMGVSLALGIFQVWVGIIVKMVSMIRSGDVYEGIISQGGWILFLPGLIGFALSKAGLFTSNVPFYVMIAGALVVMYSSSRGQKNILLKPFSGLYGLYGTVSYFSDTMSYARLLALGLASAVIAVVINKISQLIVTMIPVIGWLFVPVVLIGGHGFNLIINVLGSFIHSGRLQFVEFFTKFFEGGGKPFRPLTRVNEYVSIE